MPVCGHTGSNGRWEIRAPTPRRSAGRRSPTSRVRRRFPVGRATVGAHAFPASPSICYHARTRDRPRPGKFILPIMGNTTLPLTSAGRRPLRNEPIMATGTPIRPSPIHGALPSSPATSSPGGPRRAGLHRLAPLFIRRAFIRRAGLPTPSYYQTNPFSSSLISRYSLLSPFTKRTHNGH